MSERKPAGGNLLTVRILTVVLSAFILINVGSQIYIHLYSPYETEVALSYKITESVGFRGIYLRNEKVLSYDGGGVVSYPYADGSKIAKGSAVAYVYNSEADVENRFLADKLKEELALLERSQEKGRSETAQQETLSRFISERQIGLIAALDGGDYSVVPQKRSTLLEQLNILQIATGREADFNARITELQTTIADVLCNVTDAVETIRTQESGYFVSMVDGYEDYLRPENAAVLTQEQIDAVLSGPKLETAPNTVGKIIAGYDWKMVGVLEEKDAANFRAGAAINLRIGSEPKLPGTIESITPLEGQGKSVVVLACDRMTSSLAENRTDWAELSVRDYTGIRVPRTALRFYNEERGVFIQYGQEILFRKVNVLFETEDYAVVEKKLEKDYLQVYDELVVKGKDLYDGKPLAG